MRVAYGKLPAAQKGTTNGEGEAERRGVEEVAKGNVASRNGLTGPKHKHQNEQKSRGKQRKKGRGNERNARQVWLGVLIVVQVHVIALWALDELRPSG